jgi:hypothetical protein
MSEEKKKMPEAQEVKEILDVVSKKVPELLTELADILYGTEQSKKYGKAVAQFYKELKEAGMSNEEAFELTKQYMSIFSLGGVLGKMIGGPGGHRHHGEEDDEFHKEMRDKIKLKIRREIEEDKE